MSVVAKLSVLVQKFAQLWNWLAQILLLIPELLFGRITGIALDGTALFEGIAVIFLAYMFNIELTTTSIIVVFFVAMLASAGAPGIPSGSMSGLQVVLIAVGIPLEAIALLLLIERPLDTIRTAVNVEGDLIGSLIVHQFTSPNEGVPS